MNKVNDFFFFNLLLFINRELYDTKKVDYQMFRYSEDVILKRMKTE